MLRMKQEELLDAKRNLSLVSVNAKGTFAEWFLELFGYAGSKQVNFSKTISKYYDLLDDDAKKCFVYLKMLNEESVLADAIKYDEEFVNIRKIIELLETNEVISDGEADEYDGEAEEYDGEAEEYDGEADAREERYEVKKIDVGTQCNLIIGNEAFEKIALEIMSLITPLLPMRKEHSLSPANVPVSSAIPSTVLRSVQMPQSSPASLQKIALEIMSLITLLLPMRKEHSLSPANVPVLSAIPSTVIKSTTTSSIHRTDENGHNHNELDLETSSVYSCDAEGYYTSFHIDSGLKTLKDQSDGSLHKNRQPLKETSGSNRSSGMSSASGSISGGFNSLQFKIQSAFLQQVAANEARPNPVSRTRVNVADLPAAIPGSTESTPIVIKASVVKCPANLELVAHNQLSATDSETTVQPFSSAGSSESSRSSSLERKKRGARVTLDSDGKVVYSSDSLKRKKAQAGHTSTFIEPGTGQNIERKLDPGTSAFRPNPNGSTGAAANNTSKPLSPPPYRPAPSFNGPRVSTSSSSSLIPAVRTQPDGQSSTNGSGIPTILVSRSDSYRLANVDDQVDNGGDPTGAFQRNLSDSYRKTGMGENRVVPKFPVASLQRLNSTEPEYKSFKLESNEVTLGRSPENKCVIKNLRLSRKHAIFRLINGQWFIKSVGMNSVWVNNTIMGKNQQLPLHNMDLINLSGDNKFLYAFVELTVVSSEATATQVIQQPMVAANQKRNANTAFNDFQQSQKNSKNAGGIARAPSRQNQPITMVTAPKPVNHHTNKPSVQKKPYTIPLKQEIPLKQTQLQMFFKPVNSYLDRSLLAPSSFEASYEEPEKATTDSYQHLQTTPAPVADTDYLFQPY